MKNRLPVWTNEHLPLFKELATQYRRRLFYQLCAWGCAGALTGGLLLTGAMKLFQLRPSYSFLWPTLFAPLAAGFAYVRAPFSWPHLLREADRNLGLQEKLITLAQYYQREPDNPFLPLLASALITEVGDLAAKRVFPLPKTPFLVSAGSAVCLLILALLPGRSTPLSPPGAPPPAAPTIVAEAPGQPESFPGIGVEPGRPALEILSPSGPPDTPHETAPLDRPDLRSRLGNAPEQGFTRTEPRGKPEAPETSSPPENAPGTPGRGRQEQAPQEETAEERAEDTPDTGAGSNDSETTSIPPSPGAEAPEKGSGQNGGTVRAENVPAEDDDSSSGAGHRRTTTRPAEATAGFEPVLEYTPLATSSQVSKESFLSSYLEELYPPAPGSPPGEALFRERLRKHALLLAAEGSEELPAAYRALIREYFSLLAAEE